MIEVSIIIVSFNTKRLTLQTIKSAVTEKSKISKEIIVVDNGSTDGSMKELKKLGKSIKLIENSQNVGFSKANNQGIKIARGENVFLLNSDTLIKNNAVERLFNFASKNPKIGVVGPRLLNIDGTIQSSCIYFPTIKNEFKKYWLKDKKLINYTPIGKRPVEVEAVMGAAIFITKAALKKVDKLDERYFFYYEDIDYCKRVMEAGLIVYYFPRAEVVHYGGESGKKLADLENQWRRHIPSSKIYNGLVKHYILFFIMWSSQKWEKLSKVLGLS